MVVCAAIIVLRHKEPELPRGSRCPWVPVVPLVGIGFSIWLITFLDPSTWLRFVLWLAIGLVIYFAYSCRHSNLNTSGASRDAGDAA